MTGSPVRLLAELILAALALGGLCYGWYGRSEAFQDRQIIDLFQRLDRLEEQNRELLEQLQRYEKSK